VIRLRQAVVVAEDIDAAVAVWGDLLGTGVCFRDPGVADFGLRNALFAIGDQFLEIVSPTRPGTAAGRFLERRGGPGGYMAMFQVDDLDRRVEIVERAGVRVVWSGTEQRAGATVRGRHLHPRDVGGAIVSLDEVAPPEAWPWAGDGWATMGATSASGIARITVGADDPAAMAARWTALGLTDSVAFAPAGDRGDGVDEICLVASDPSRAGDRADLTGISVRFV
jgi:Glyoxalase-like domain